MSEYKLTLHASIWGHRIGTGFYVLCLLSIWLWPQRLDEQWLVQLLLSGPVLWVIFRHRFDAEHRLEMVLTDMGEIFVYDDKDQSFPYKLSSKSVTSDWFCHLVLLPDTLPGSTGKIMRLWVFRDALDELSYRRLCRVIHRLRG